MKTNVFSYIMLACRRTEGWKIGEGRNRMERILIVEDDKEIREGIGTHVPFGWRETEMENESKRK